MRTLSTRITEWWSDQCYVTSEAHAALVTYHSSRITRHPFPHQIVRHRPGHFDACHLPDRQSLREYHHPIHFRRITVAAR